MAPGHLPRGFMSKKIHFAAICVVFVFLALVFAAWYGTGPGAAEKKNFLADRHKGKGVECSGCHNESPPKAAVPMATCLKCHGSYAKVAKRTDNTTPNPHASHMEVKSPAKTATTAISLRWTAAPSAMSSGTRCHKEKYRGQVLKYQFFHISRPDPSNYIDFLIFREQKKNNIAEASNNSRSTLIQGDAMKRLLNPRISKRGRGFVFLAALI